MPTPITPEEWLPVLAAKLDAQYKAIGRVRRYAHGDADLPEMGKNLKASWESFQKRARTDYGGIAVRSLRNRIRPNGYRIGESQDDPALEVLRRIERGNALQRQFRDAIRDYLEVGVGYVAIREEGAETLVRREKPEKFYALPDDVKPWKANASIKVWRDTIAGVDYARVCIPDASQLFSRPSQTSGGSQIGTAADGAWAPHGEPAAFVAGDTATVILDRGDDGPLLAPHLDVIDRINYGKLQRLVTTAMQAFRQRAIKAGKDSGGLPETDESGNAIDWAKAFEPAPGALWELPEGIDIWESEHTDITPMLTGEKQDARDFAAATGTPVSVLVPEGENQSAEGAANAKEQQIAQASDDIDRVKHALALVLVYALRAAGSPLPEGVEAEVLFAPPEHVSLSERFAAAVQAKNAGLSGRTIKRDILGMTPDQIAQDEADQGADMLAAALLGGNGKPTPGDAESTPADEKARFDALGAAVRAGVDPDDAATRLGMAGVRFTGAVPVSLRMPQSEAAGLEQA